MGNPAKIIAKWQGSRPTSVPVQHVITVLDKYFPGEWHWGKGSHIVVRSKMAPRYIEWVTLVKFN